MVGISYYPTKPFRRICVSISFAAGNLCPVDIRLITFHYLLQHQFESSLFIALNLRQGLNIWWIAEWTKTAGNGYITTEFSLPLLNVLDTVNPIHMFNCWWKNTTGTHPLPPVFIHCFIQHILSSHVFINWRKYGVGRKHKLAMELIVDSCQVAIDRVKISCSELSGYTYPHMSFVG